MSTPGTTLKVVSLNTWHGLNGRGKLYFGLLESRAERIARLARQVNALRALDADVILLQEVNPLPFRAHWYARELHKHVEHASCNAGVKLGWGPPWNLNEGLAILTPQDWKVESLGSKRLSGGFRFSPLRISQVGGPYLSLQLHESRMGLALRLHLPRHRQHVTHTGITSVLIGVAHLHQPPALTPGTERILDEASAEGLTPDERTYLVRAFRKANARRVSEVDTLASWLERLRKPGEPIILGGDFNCEPESAPMKTLQRHGWGDTWRMMGKSEDAEKAATWDPPRNPLAWRFQDFRPSHDDGLGPIARRAIQKTDALARRIDYLFVYPPSHADTLDKSTSLGCLGQIRQAQRFGYLTGNPLTHAGLGTELGDDYEARIEHAFEPSDASRYVSDHFGVAAEFGLPEE